MSITAANVDVREADAPHLGQVFDKAVRSVAIPWSATLSMTVNAVTDTMYGIDRRGSSCETTLSLKPRQCTTAPG